EELTGIRNEQKQFREELTGIRDEQKQFREELTELRTDQKQFREEVRSEFREVKHDIKRIDEKLDLLTKQTSNAIIEHHSNQITFLKDKVFELEEEMYKIKKR
ncbi:hypothetical protein, partial [Tenuibacillus multivorans]|uniref:hypothetical protein n=1 Tax=Tenuibacillus multivorans TaxID=237069 RepID=UPI0035309F3E